MVGSAVATIVWDRAATSIPNISPTRTVRICRCVSSGITCSPGAPGTPAPVEDDVLIAGTFRGVRIPGQMLVETGVERRQKGREARQILARPRPQQLPDDAAPFRPRRGQHAPAVLGEPQLESAPVIGVRFARDKAGLLQGRDLSADRRGVQMEVRCELTGPQRAGVMEPREDPVGGPLHDLLCRAAAQVHLLGTAHQQGQLLLDGLHRNQVRL
jgi:hypothetical protein